LEHALGVIVGPLPLEDSVPRQRGRLEGIDLRLLCRCGLRLTVP
jgi:hypothetical protein